MAQQTGGWDLPNVITNIGNVAQHVGKAAEEFAHRWTIYFMWGYANKPGDHGKVPALALDLMVYELGGGVNSPGPRRMAMGDEMAAWAIRHRVRLGLTYVIWNRRIASANSNPDWSWRPYDGSNPHIDHPHLSFKASHTYKPAPGEEDDMFSDADRDKLEFLFNNLGRIGSLREKDSKGNQVFHAAGYYHAHADRNAFDVKAILQQKVLPALTAEQQRDVAEGLMLQALQAAVAELRDGLDGDLSDEDIAKLSQALVRGLVGAVSQPGEPSA
jgi:hypothetical protein